MTKETNRAAWAPVGRALEGLIPPFHVGFTMIASLALLGLAAGAILNLRSIKYLGAVIVLSVAGAAFLALPRKFDFFLFASGLTIPYYVSVILLERDRTDLVVTGTSLVIAVLAIVALATGVIDKSSWTFEPGISVPMLAFLCAGLLSIVNTTDRTLTLMALAQELEMVLIFLVLINVIRNEAQAVTFLRGLYLGFALQCVIYGIQNFVGFSFDILGNTKFTGATDLEAGRIGSQRGTFANAPACAALYFSMMTLSLTGLHLCRRKLAIRLLPILGMMMGFVCLLLSAKRAAMLGFALALLSMIVLLLFYSRGALRKLLPMLGGLVMAFLVCLPVFLIRFGADHQAAYEERVNLTRVAWNMYDAHPVAGVGFGTYDSVKHDYLPPDWTGWLYTVHTRYLLILAETGVVGFAALLLVYFMILRAAYMGIRDIAPDFRPLQISLLAGLVAVYWEQLWDIFNSRQQEYLLWFLAAMVVALPRALASTPSREEA